MQTDNLKLKIGHIYPDILQAFCDEANIDAFTIRAKARDISIEYCSFNSNEAIKECDFYYIGGTNPLMLPYAIKYLNENSKILNVLAAKEVPMLLVNLGYVLFGMNYQILNYPKTKGLGILNTETIFLKERIKEPVVGICDFISNENVVGYKNHTSSTYLKVGTSPFLTVIKGVGNNREDDSEGARFKNVIGTYITSPILAQNPPLCDYLIETALRVKYKTKIPLAPIVDDVEWYSHNYMLEMK